MDTATSDWLTELIESPSVFIQNEVLIVSMITTNMAPDYFMERETHTKHGFAPINIKNASYTWKTNKFSQKLFQYDLKWEMSNINIGR